MVKKCGSKKRRISQGIQRRKVHGKRATNSEGRKPRFVAHVGNICYNYIIRVCTLLRLVPLKVDTDGNRADFVSLRDRTVHSLLALFYLSVTIYRFGVVVQLLAQKELNIATFMCISSFLLSLISICSACGSSWATLELKELLNSRKSLLESLEEVTGEHVELMTNMPLCLKVIAVSYVVQMSAVNAAAFSLVYDDLPVCVFPTLQRLGILPQTSVRTVLWKIGFFPVELFILFPPMCTTAFNGHALMVAVATLQVYGDNLRSVYSNPPYHSRSMLK